MPTPEPQIARLFAHYPPAIAKLGRALRKKLRQRLQGLNELVYHYASRDSLVLSYSPSEAGGEAVCALAIYPRHVHLCFLGGEALTKSDPRKLLQGRGRSMRYLVLESLADYDRPEIEVLMSAALHIAKVQLDANSEGAVILKVEAQQQRARQRATKAARHGSTARTRAARQNGHARGKRSS